MSDRATNSNIVWTPQPKQALFISCAADWVLFGGGAGGGKSDALLADFLRYIGDRYYQGILFRRSYPELEELIARSRELYEPLGAKYNESKKVWRFPSGATLKFRYAEKDDDIRRYQGHAYQWCVGVGTMILMGDGSHKRIEDICKGDEVMTLIGPRRINRVSDPYRKRSYRLDTAHSSTIIGEGHKVLTERGWASPLELIPIPRLQDLPMLSVLPERCQASGKPSELTSGDQAQVIARGQQYSYQGAQEGFGASTEDVESDCEACCDLLQGLLQPVELSSRLVLHAPSFHQSLPDSDRAIPARVQVHDLDESSGAGFLFDCRGGFDFHDAQSHHDQGFSLMHTPLQGGAEGRIPSCCTSDDLDCIRGRTLEGKVLYFHPYTTANQGSSEAVLLSEGWLSQAGESMVVDLEVDEASHYISFGGIVSQNCGFDELTHFTKYMWDYMSTRNRPRRDGQKCVMRATCNPDGKGLNWVKAMFIDVAKPMQLVRRWVTNPITGDRQCITQKFIPSLLKDNAYLRDTSYALRMANLGEADRKALLEGDWEAYVGTVFNLVEGVHKWSWDKLKEITGHSKIPDDWLRFRLMDWGFAKPFAVLWIAVDYEGRAYVYREYYGCAVDGNGRFIPNEGVRQTAQAVARKIADIERETGERISFAWSGPDIDHLGRGDHELGRKISESFRDEGIYWDHWNANAGSRIAKKQHLHGRLSYDIADDGTIKRYPALVILRDECPHLIRTLPMLEYDKHIPEDVNSDGEDHLYDALAGFCLMRTWEPVRKRIESKWDRGRERGEGWTM